MRELGEVMRMMLRTDQPVNSLRAGLGAVLEGRYLNRYFM